MGFKKSRYEQIKLANQMAQGGLESAAPVQPGAQAGVQLGGPITVQPGGSVTVQPGGTVTVQADGTITLTAGRTVTIIPISIEQAYKDHIDFMGTEWADTTQYDATNLYKRLVAHCLNPVDVEAMKRNPAHAKKWERFKQLKPIENMCDLTAQHFAQFFALLKIENVSARGYGIRFITLLNWAIQRCYIPIAEGELCVKKVWVPRKKAIARKVEPLTNDQFGRVLDYLARGIRKGKKNAFRDLLIIRLAHNLCLRTGDIRGLCLKHVLIDHTKIDVFRKGSRWQIIKVDVPDLWASLLEYIEFRLSLPGVPTDPDSPLFLVKKHHALSSGNIYSVVSKTLRRCGIYRPSKKGGHVLRATGALFRLYSRKNNIDQVRELLGHKSLATTDKYINPPKDYEDDILNNRETSKLIRSSVEYGRYYEIQKN